MGLKGIFLKRNTVRPEEGRTHRNPNSVRAACLKAILALMWAFRALKTSRRALSQWQFPQQAERNLCKTPGCSVEVPSAMPHEQDGGALKERKKPSCGETVVQKGVFAFRCRTNPKGAEKKPTRQNTLLDDRFPAQRLLRSFSAL